MSGLYEPLVPVGNVFFLNDYLHPVQRHFPPITLLHNPHSIFLTPPAPPSPFSSLSLLFMATPTMSASAITFSDSCSTPTKGPSSPTGRARPNAVLAAVAAAPQNTVRATVMAESRTASQAFANADAKNIMGSAWKFTADYARYLGCEGLVAEVHSAGAVKICFDKGSYWFPAAAVAQFLLPPPSQSLERLGFMINQSPSSSVATTLMDVVRAYPQLSGIVMQKLTSHNRGYSSPALSSSMGSNNPPTPLMEEERSSLAQRVSWNSMLAETEPVVHGLGGGTPSRGSGGGGGGAYTMHSQYLPSDASQMSTPASVPEFPPYNEPVASPKTALPRLEEDVTSTWDPPVSIVSQVIDDIFDEPNETPSS